MSVFVQITENLSDIKDTAVLLIEILIFAMIFQISDIHCSDVRGNFVCSNNRDTFVLLEILLFGFLKYLCSYFRQTFVQIKYILLF